MEPFEAAKLAVYWHGVSGDIMAAEKGVHSLMASDLIDGMSRAAE
jgi:NAD(P)H-hydrate epimerase